MSNMRALAALPLLFAVASARMSSASAASRARVRGGSFTPARLNSDQNCYVPRFEPTYNMTKSTIVMPCSDSGFFNTSATINFGVVDFDWSNAKQHWANQKPMTCEEDLVTQAALVKAVNPETKVWVYRNLVKSLPWYRNVWTKLADPAFAGWFVMFDAKNTTPYHVKQCDDNYSPPLCSPHYHDQDQTPGYPHGDGSCDEPCDCGGVPCGEYLWDHRNDTLRSYLLNEVVLGANGLANENISGFYFDDGWSDSSQPILPWEPKMGFCDHSPIGGATEEDLYCTVDSGLTQADTTAMKREHDETMNLVTDAVIAAGGFVWQALAQTSLPAASDGVAACDAWFTAAHGLGRCAYMHEVFNPQQRPLVAVDEDLAAFLIARGPFAWIGYGWIGCTTEYEFPDAWTIDYGVPLTSYFNMTAPSIYSREYSKATATFDCTAWKGTVTMK